MGATINDILGNSLAEINQNAAAQINDAGRVVGEVAKKKEVHPGSTVISDPTKTKRPSIEQDMAAWRVQNPAPVRQEVKEPEYKHTYNYQDILDQYKKVDQEDPKEAKRQKWNESIAAVGDALTALVNAGGVSNGANNMALDPSEGMSEKLRKRYQETRDKQKTDREKYLNLMLKAAQLEDADNMKKYSLYQTAQQKADSDYNSKLAIHNRAEDQYHDNLLARQKAADDAEYKKEDLERKKQAEEDRKEYQKDMLDIRREANSIRREEKEKSSENKRLNESHIGGLTRSRSMDDQQTAIAIGEMRRAGAIDEKTYKKWQRRGLADGTVLEMGARTEAGKKVLRDHDYK